MAGAILVMIDMMRFDIGVQGTQQDPDNQNNQNRDAQDFEDDHWVSPKARWGKVHQSSIDLKLISINGIQPLPNGRGCSST
jgi:hypothetical protein